jgi:hypothetical protein
MQEGLMPTPLRDKLKERATPYLQPGEQVQAAFVAMAMSPWWAALSSLILLAKNPYRTIVATDRRILVFSNARRSVTKGEFLREVPRATRIGPFTGKANYKTEALGEKLYINRRFKNDVQQADAAIGA